LFFWLFLIINHNGILKNAAKIVVAKEVPSKVEQFCGKLPHLDFDSPAWATTCHCIHALVDF
jgi:hypothetical protein